MTPRAFDEPTDELLFRYVAGQCTSPERLNVEGWLRRDAGNASRVENMRRIWHASHPSPARDVDRMWTRLRGAMEHTPALRSESGTVDEAFKRPIRHAGLTRLSRRGFPAGAWAAALVALIGGGAIYVSRSRPAPPPPPPAAPHVYATGPAQTADIRLRDGSRVMLAPKSRLRVPDDFGSHDRLVTIEGQGFFDVVHNAAIPFRVRAKGAVAQDIGTRFDVRAYEDESGVVVIVADGAVTFGRARSDSTARRAEGVVVRRGERARTGGPDSTTTVDRVSLRLVGWTEGRLSFVNTPLAEIARAIGRWYDLDVRVSDAALEGRLITADFDAQAPREMVEALATARNGVVERHGRVLSIRAKP
jgi:transmembrane sensor